MLLKKAVASGARRRERNKESRACPVSTNSYIADTTDWRSYER